MSRKGDPAISARPRTLHKAVADAVKSLLGRLLFHSRLHRLFLRDVGFAVVFHSVVRDAPYSSLRCSDADFERFCRFLKRYFRVVPLSELSRLQANGGSGGHAAISFDDGYADNAQIAAPILRALSLPATFFVVTGFIGTDEQAAWDRKHGVHSRWMTWDEVRALAADGFEIGAHSTHHQDMASFNREQFEADLKQSLVVFKEQTSHVPVGFAYPFGSLRHTNAHGREILQRQGFSYCALAEGGLVNRGSDVMDLPRIPVSGSQYADEYVLGFEVVRAALVGRWGKHVEHHTHAMVPTRER